MQLLATVLLSMIPLLVSAEGSTVPAPVTKAAVYQTDKYGNRVGQAYEVRGDKVYATDKYGNRIGQAFVIKGKTPPPGGTK